MGSGRCTGEEAATPSWGTATAALPIFGQSRFVCFRAPGSVVVVVGALGTVVVVDGVGVVVVVDPPGSVVVVGPPGSVVVVDPVAVAGDEASSGLRLRAKVVSATTEIHGLNEVEAGFTRSM